MKEKKMYYNLTRIFNGWLLAAPLVVAGANLGWASQRYFASLKEVLVYIEENYKLFNRQWGKDTEGLSRTLKTEYLIELKKKGLLKDDYKVVGESMDGDGNHEVILNNVKEEKS